MNVPTCLLLETSHFPLSLRGVGWGGVGWGGVGWRLELYGCVICRSPFAIRD